MATNEEGSNNGWSWQQVKAFERGLTYFPEGCEARWEKIAALIPGDKSLQQVIDHYKLLLDDVAAIEAGVPVLPKESATGSSSNDVAAFEAGGSSVPKEPNTEEPDHQKGKKRKGEAWTEEEHRQFLLGMESVGKGEWKIIAREFVKSRNPTQVASHAQKHFKRQNENKQNVRRWSIFDLASLDDPEHLTGFKCASCGFMNHIETPVTINEAPSVIKETPAIVIKETPSVIKQTPLVIPEAPLVIQEAHLMMQETPPVMQEAAPVIQEAPPVMQETVLVMQEAPLGIQEVPLAMKKTTLVIQEARDGGIMVGPRVEPPSLSPMDRLCVESDGDLFSQLSPL